jgi:hypothetical protein
MGKGRTMHITAQSVTVKMTKGESAEGEIFHPN